MSQAVLEPVKFKEKREAPPKCFQCGRFCDHLDWQDELGYQCEACQEEEREEAEVLYGREEDEFADDYEPDDEEDDDELDEFVAKEADCASQTAELDAGLLTYLARCSLGFGWQWLLETEAVRAVRALAVEQECKKRRKRQQAQARKERAARRVERQAELREVREWNSQLWAKRELESVKAQMRCDLEKRDFTPDQVEAQLAGLLRSAGDSLQLSRSESESRCDALAALAGAVVTLQARGLSKEAACVVAERVVYRQEAVEPPDIISFGSAVGPDLEQYGEWTVHVFDPLLGLPRAADNFQPTD